MNPTPLTSRLRRERVRKLIPTSVRLEPEVVDRLARVAARHSTTIAGLVRASVDQILDELDPANTQDPNKGTPTPMREGGVVR